MGPTPDRSPGSGNSTWREPVYNWRGKRPIYMGIVRLVPTGQKLGCNRCGSQNTVKYGKRPVKGQPVQLYRCKDCGYKFSPNLTPFGMQFPTEAIGAAIGMFYNGSSFDKIRQNLEAIYGGTVNRATIWRWVIKYSRRVDKALEGAHPKVGNIWFVDETVVKVAGKNTWFWDIIDNDTRFLMGSHLSTSRTLGDAVKVIENAKKLTQKAPKFIVSDGLAAYPDAVERVYGADSKHIRSMGFTHAVNTNLIERFHGTLKDRTKVMRGLKTTSTAKTLLTGFLIHYNYIRPHTTLAFRTPALASGLEPQFENWIDLVRILGGKE